MKLSIKNRVYGFIVWDDRGQTPNNALTLAFLEQSYYNLTCKINRFWRLIMANVSTIKMSSRGQVVIPVNIRRNLNLKAGALFMVIEVISDKEK